MGHVTDPFFFAVRLEVLLPARNDHLSRGSSQIQSGSVGPVASSVCSTHRASTRQFFSSCICLVAVTHTLKVSQSVSHKSHGSMDHGETLITLKPRFFIVLTGGRLQPFNHALPLQETPQKEPKAKHLSDLDRVGHAR